ncbi:helix-turn-helix domain-containing protein [Flexilinea flocculi]|jgi:putative transcriptional regulator|uniref:Helix-turn-helix n=1 Tax=Flexilinea flocculi TaxID=1678840 RepID=A0A0K8PB11_9CHLR|nr:helix-turn-helix domain-containing protein [Flexilinea flocculi]GAP39689.1 helix-turn-helix [Flexilinea flocculi]
MKNELFEGLCESLNQAIAIEKGTAKPSRKFTYEPIDIRKIREKHDLSQKQFANKLGISPSTLRNWEQGSVYRNTKSNMRSTLISE